MCTGVGLWIAVVIHVHSCLNETSSFRTATTLPQDAYKCAPARALDLAVAIIRSSSAAGKGIGGYDTSPFRRGLLERVD